jgi:hypothetical protein
LERKPIGKPLIISSQNFAVTSRAPIIGRAKFAYGEICAGDVVKKDRQGNEVVRAIFPTKESELVFDVEKERA